MSPKNLRKTSAPMPKPGAPSPGGTLSDEVKNAIRPGQSVELLKALHILTQDGRLNQDSRRKLKQVYHLYQFIEKLLLELPVRSGSGDASTSEPTVADHVPASPTSDLSCTTCFSRHSTGVAFTALRPVQSWCKSRNSWRSTSALRAWNS